MVVVLPAPFGPRKPVTVPGSSSNETSSTTVRSPYFLVGPLTVIAGVSSDRPAWSRERHSRPGTVRRIGRPARTATAKVEKSSDES